MQQFLEVFSELKGKKLYLTGESVRFPSKISFLIVLFLNLTSNSMPEHMYLVSRILRVERRAVSLNHLRYRGLHLWTSHGSGSQPARHLDFRSYVAQLHPSNREFTAFLQLLCLGMSSKSKSPLLTLCTNTKTSFLSSGFSHPVAKESRWN